VHVPDDVAAPAVFAYARPVHALVYERSTSKTIGRMSALAIALAAIAGCSMKGRAESCVGGASATCRSLVRQCAGASGDDANECWDAAMKMSVVPASRSAGVEILDDLCKRRAFYCFTLYTVGAGAIASGDASGMEILSRACERGQAQACGEIGHLVSSGHLSEQGASDASGGRRRSAGYSPAIDKPEGLRHLLRACRMGFRRSEGWGKDPPRSDSNGAEACYSAAEMLGRGDGVPKDEAFAAQLSARGESLRDKEGEANGAQAEADARDMAIRDREWDEKMKRLDDGIGTVRASSDDLAAANGAAGASNAATTTASDPPPVSGRTESSASTTARGSGSTATPPASTSTSAAAGSEPSVEEKWLRTGAEGRWACGENNAIIFAQSDCATDLRGQCAALKGALQSITQDQTFCSSRKGSCLDGKEFHCTQPCHAICKVRSDRK